MTRICDARKKVWIQPCGVSGEVAISKIKFTFSFFNTRSPQDVIFLKSAPATIDTTATIKFQNEILNKNAGIDAELGSIIDRRTGKEREEFTAIYDRVSDYYEKSCSFCKTKKSPYCY